MTDAETGLRGFQVSGGERSLLEPYTHGEQRTRSALRTVRTLLVTRRGGRRDHARVLAAQTAQETAAAAWWAYAHASVEGYRPGIDPGVDRAKPLFDRFRAANAAVGQRLKAERDIGRTATVENLNLDTVLVLVLAVAAMLLAAFVGRRMTRVLTGPLDDLHGVVTRQNGGERDLRAREDRRSPRSVTWRPTSTGCWRRTSGSTSSRPRGADAPADARRRAACAGTDVQGALDVLCAVLGEGLGVDRVMANTVDDQHRVVRGAQWHGGDLEPLGDVRVVLAHHVGSWPSSCGAAGRLRHP